MPQHTLVWHNGVLDADLSDANAERWLRDPAALVWYDLEGDPAEHEHILLAECRFPQRTIDSILDGLARPKLREVDENAFYLVMHGLTFDPQSEEAQTPKLDIIFRAGLLVTVHRNPLPWLDDLRETARRREPTEHIMSQGVAYLLYIVLDTLVDTYFPALDAIDDVVDDLENVTVRDTSNAVQSRLFHMKREIAQVRRVIGPQVEVLNGLVTRTGSLVPRKVEHDFADVHDHMVRAFEILDSYRDLMSGLLDVYLTTVSNRLNEVMKQLTLIATIFLPITFVTGVFGQNFGHSPQVDHDFGFNFWLVLLLMAIITAGQLWYFRRRKWI